MNSKQENNVNIRLFNNLDTTNEEIDYINSVLNIDASNEKNTIYLQRKVSLSILFLAKQIEASSKSNDRNAKRMYWLTLVLGAFGLVQLAELILKLYRIID